MAECQKWCYIIYEEVDIDFVEHALKWKLDEWGCTFAGGQAGPDTFKSYNKVIVVISEKSRTRLEADLPYLKSSHTCNTAMVYHIELDLQCPFHTFKPIRTVKFGSKWRDDDDDYRNEWIQLKLFVEELDVDPRTQAIYLRALKDGSELDMHIRVIIVGNFGQGKTTLTCRLLGKDIKTVQSTNGIDLSVDYCSNSKNGNWEPIPKDKLDPINRLAANASTCKETNDTVLPSTSNVSNIGEKPPPISVDTEHNTLNTLSVSFKEFEGVFKNIEESSSSEDEFVISIWDFGGHAIFYATHQLFHSKKAIYLLVSDLSKELDDNVMDVDCDEEENLDVQTSLKFWVQSIHSFVGSEDGKTPPIFLVGTHCDQLNNNVEAQKRLKNIAQMFVGTECLLHIQNEHFAIDNIDSRDPGIAKLRKAIEETFKQMPREKTPLKWIPLERAIKNLPDKPFITLEEIIQLDNANDSRVVKDKEHIEELKAFLHFHHNRGTFIYFDEEHLSGYIVKEPTYLINAFKAIITAKKFRTVETRLLSDLETLNKEGRLSESFLNHVWCNSGFGKDKEKLILFLERNRILSRVFHFNEETNERVYHPFYFIPSLLKSQIAPEDLANFIKDSNKKSTMIALVYVFDNSTIVPTVYHRLTAAALAKWSIVEYNNAYLIYKNAGVYKFDVDYVGIICLNENKIEIRLVNLIGANIDGKHGNSLRRFTEHIMRQEFGKLQSLNQSSKFFEICVRCFCSSCKLGCKKLYKLQEFDGKNVISCLEYKHKIPVKDALNEWADNRDIPSLILSEKHCEMLSRIIGRGLEQLGVHLGIDICEIQQIQENYRYYNQQVFHTLIVWRSRKLEQATMKALVGALEICEMKFNRDIILNIVDKFE